MEQLNLLKLLLGNPTESDAVLQFYLDSAKEIICELRHTTDLESQYLTIQVRIAIELYNKRGAEGQVGHSENGIDRTYEVSDISPSLLNLVTPVIRTPFSTRHV
jgi:hypothetical protein